MSRQSMVLKLTRANDQSPEGVTLKSDNTWSSPGGGWLPDQSGVWEGDASGTHLKNAGNTVVHATLLGCNFFLSSKNQTGVANYFTVGDSGNWLVIDTTP